MTKEEAEEPFETVAAAPVAEPKKRESKKAAEPPPTTKQSLDEVVKAWSDEE
jgi:hypothetical protein